MSALGHYLEDEGLATVSISLIRPQTENTRPPRALWVPFELGRPFGPPGDAAFQRNVLLTALKLLEADGGPVLLVDFPHDDPRWQPDPDWKPPLISADTHSGDAATIANRLSAEIRELDPAHHQWLIQHGRSTVGITGLGIEDTGRYVGAWLRGENPASLREGMSAPLLLRFAVDDLKAYALEAAAAGSTKPSSRQLGDWLWQQTETGAAIHALREGLLHSEDNRLRLIAENFLVPGSRVRKPQ